MAKKEKKYRLLPLDYIKKIGRFDETVMELLGFPKNMQNWLSYNAKKEVSVEFMNKERIKSQLLLEQIDSLLLEQIDSLKIRLVRINYAGENPVYGYTVPSNWIVRIK